MFELKQLRCFVAVATEMNFRRAAERLNMTQPPLSRQIQLLEHQLGVSLFDRNNRSVRLTAAGRTFLNEAQALLVQAQQAVLSAQRAEQGEEGRVSIGFVAGAVYEFLPSVVQQIQSQHPLLDIELREMNTFSQLEALHGRRIDLGIVRSALGQHGFVSECLVREPFVLALPASHPLIMREYLSLSDLHDQPFIMYSQSGWQPFYEMLSGAFHAAGVAPNCVQHIGSTLTILALVNAGVGVALVPRSAAWLKLEQLVCRSIELPAGVSSELHLVWRDDSDNPALSSVCAALRQAARGGGQPSVTGAG